jgi:hypothetical protein
MAELLMTLSKRRQSRDYLAHLRNDLAASRVARLAPANAPVSRDPGLARWHASGSTRPGGLLPAWWVAHEGHVAHLLGPEHEFLLFDYPLTGTFEFSADAYQGGWAEGHLGYAGLVFEPSQGQSTIWPVGRHDQLYRPVTSLRPDTFNRLTVQIEPGKVRCLVNGHLFYEEKDPSPTSPWLALFGSGERHTVFRNLTLRGTPQIPRAVPLSHGDRLDGWVTSFYNESQPPRISKNGPQPGDDEGVDEVVGGRRPSRRDPVFDWSARDGEIHGRRSEDAAGPAPSRLAYFRPLRPGDTLRYEFFYKPGEVMVHPGLGRLVFLLQPERVRLHWLADGDGNDWTGLAVDNAVDDPAPGPGGKPLPLKADAWNTLRLSLSKDGVRLELNGTPVYEHKLEPDNDRVFGLFHYKDQTEARARQVMLTGDWPEKLPPEVLADPLGGAGAAANGVARRAIIGEHFFLLNAAGVLEQTRALSPEERYERLRDWVLPGPGHALFQMAGDFTPADPAPHVVTIPSAGRRLHTGGELVAPALELVALAGKLGKLDDLAGRVEKASPEADPRGRLALLAVVRAAQGRDADAAEALKQMLPLVTKLPLDAPTWQRWPELVAAGGSVQRPALRPPAIALLDRMVRQLEQGRIKEVPLPGRDDWARQVRHARARAEVLNLPDGQRAAFGVDPGLRLWAPVTHARAATRGGGAPPAHWSFRDGVVRHYPGQDQDYLYLRVPLRGDFEVRGDLTTFDWRETRLAYGGLRFDLKYDRKSYDLTAFGRRVRPGVIEPPLPPLGDWYAFRLVVRDGTWTVYVNDRKVCEEALSGDADPWLMVHAADQTSGGVRNLRVLGKPTVPESLALTSRPDLNGWHSYYDDPASGTGAWQKRGEEVFSRGNRPDFDDLSDRPALPRTHEERALFYHRPLLEDGTVEYEFYYEPDKAHASPALDRLVFLLHPTGVQVHWLTDGRHDRTGLAPDNATTEPENRRGPAALPLKPRAWNRLKLALKGDAVALRLNGVEVYERTLESTNQRTFGLFHYADATDLRVRNVTYRGEWPRPLPDAAALLR